MSYQEKEMMMTMTHVKRIGNQSESINFMLNMQCISFFFEAIVKTTRVEKRKLSNFLLWMNNVFFLFTQILTWKMYFS